MNTASQTQVLYNAECPVCNFEIQAYARHARAQGLPIRFDDLSASAREHWGLEVETAARRLHVLHQGQLTSGIPAFLVLWAQMPRYRWLARVVGLPVLRPLAELLYDRVLAPVLYLWHQRRRAKAGA